jgi:hypothetical protein
MQPMWPSISGASVPTRVQVVAAVGEVRAAAAVDAATVDQQRLGAVGQGQPLGLVLV